MMSSDLKKRGLGRGLSALLPTAGTSPSRMAVGTESPTKRTYFAAQIEQVYPGPEQPRTNFAETELGELADSIRIHGIITPLIVRPRPEGGYFLIAGERRWRAAQRAGLHEVPVVVQEVDGQVAFERALVENLQRSDLGAIEEAVAFQRLQDEFRMTQDQIADHIGKDRSTVANSIRLLKLPPRVRQMVEDKSLAMGHARALLGLDDAAAIERAARTVIDKQLNARQVEALVRGDRNPARAKPRKQLEKSASVRDLEERLTKAIGGPVAITELEPGKSGTIQIKYLNLDHLDRLLDRLL
jgi:ParB family transcriptional regulator, chromosome partitioning protein